MGSLIDGRRISKQIKKEVKAKIDALEQGVRKPSLAVVLVGQNPASQVYVKNKKKACDTTGIRSLVYELAEDTSEDELLALVATLNEAEDVDGILVQLPLPTNVTKPIDESKVLLTIKPDKDVDGFHPYNAGLLSIGRPMLKPATAAGVVELLKRSEIGIAGKNCVVVGRSNIVGKPTALLLLAENGTVTVCHSRTENLAAICRNADILVAAVGKPNFIGPEMIRDGAVVIDVGIHQLGEKKLCGDVDFERCHEKASFITPVPGGVGPMTIAVLMENCFLAYQNHMKTQNQ